MGTISISELDVGGKMTSSEHGRMTIIGIDKKDPHYPALLLQSPESKQAQYLELLHKPNSSLYVFLPADKKKVKQYTLLFLSRG